MTKEQTDVKSWMQKFGQETPDKPVIPSLEVRKLRAKLILEEALETIQALGLELWIDSYIPNWIKVTEYKFEQKGEPNLIQIADGLADLHYVGYCGTAVACGIDMEPVFVEVHRSNMSKLWNDYEAHALLTDKKWVSSNDTIGAKIQTDVYIAVRVAKDKWLVKNSDGKVIKSPSYSPANIVL